MLTNVNKQFSKLFSSIIISLSIIAICYIAVNILNLAGVPRRLAILLGGDLAAGGYIQLLTFVAFFWALLDIRGQRKELKAEKKAYQARLLPTNEKHLLIVQDIIELQVAAAEFEKKQKRKFLLSSLIRRVCNKFRSSQSIPEILEIISIQTEINKEKAESNQSTIRYLVWVIPSIGFIGTVLGISQALAIANSGEMEVITATLGVAFDTTLVSLILSIIVMWFVHALQQETDNLHAGIKEHLIEKLINKIEVS
jgi:biopolymer transport protein ExbB/TolQ